MCVYIYIYYTYYIAAGLRLVRVQLHGAEARLRLRIDMVNILYSSININISTCSHILRYGTYSLSYILVHICNISTY